MMFLRINLWDYVHIKLSNLNLIWSGESCFGASFMLDTIFKIAFDGINDYAQGYFNNER